MECVLNVFIDIRMSIFCGVPQKIKTGEGHKQNKREEAKMVSDSENERGPIVSMPLNILRICEESQVAFYNCRDSLLVVTYTISETYLEPSGTSMMERFCHNS